VNLHLIKPTIAILGLLISGVTLAQIAAASTHEDPLAREAMTMRHVPQRAFHAGEYNMVAASPQDAAFRAAALVKELKGKKHKVATKSDGTSIVIADQTSHQIFRIHQGDLSDTIFDPTTVEVLAQLFPKNARILYATSEDFESRRNWAKAMEYFKRNSVVGSKAELVDPAEPREPLLKSSRYNSTCAFYESMLGRNVEALKYYERAIAISPTYSINFANRAQLYKKMGKLDLSAKDTARAKELQKNEGKAEDTMHNFGDRRRGCHVHNMSYTQNNYEQNLKNISEELKALEKSPLNLAKANFYLQRARMLKQLGRYKESLSDYMAIAKFEQYNSNLAKERTLTQDLSRTGAPNYGDLKAIGGAEYFGGEPVRAISVSALAGKKGDTRVYYAIAEGLSKAHRLKECAAEIDKLLKIEPDNSTFIMARIAVSEALNDATSVAKYCSLFIDKLTTGDASVELDYAQRLYDFRAKAEYALTQYDKAAADYTTLLKLDPRSPEAFRGRADCYTKLNKFDLAKDDLESATRFDQTQTGIKVK